MYQALFNPGHGEGAMNKTDVIFHGAYVLMEIKKHSGQLPSPGSSTS